MSCVVKVLSLFAWAVILGAASVCAQLPTSDRSRMEPRVGKPGQQVEVTLFGTRLDQVTELRFTHAGSSAKPVMLPAKAPAFVEIAMLAILPHIFEYDVTITKVR